MFTVRDRYGETICEFTRVHLNNAEQHQEDEHPIPV